MVHINEKRVVHMTEQSETKKLHILRHFRGPIEDILNIIKEQIPSDQLS